MRTPGSTRRAPRRCVFCDQVGNLSHEHLFADWMRRAYCFNENELTSFQQVDLGAVETRRRQGRATGMTARRVCVRCNTGWMHDIEDNAKPLLRKLIDRDRFHIRLENLKLLSTWLAIKATVAHAQEDDSLQFVPQTDREIIFRRQEPPPHWQLFLGGSTAIAGRGQIARFYQTSTTVTAEGETPTSDCSLLMSIGGLSAFVLISSRGLLTELQQPLVRRIWPPGDVQRIIWPRAIPMTPFEEHRLATALSRRTIA